MGRPAPVQPWYVPRTPEERELWDQAKLEIKNFLLVNKEGVNATKILNFLQDQGVHIPCHKFGLTFNQFLFHIQDTIEVRCFCRHFNISSRTKYIFLRQSAVDPETRHILEMVHGQMPDKKRNGLPRPTLRNTEYCPPEVLLDNPAPILHPLRVQPVYRGDGRAGGPPRFSQRGPPFRLAANAPCRHPHAAGLGFSGYGQRNSPVSRDPPNPNLASSGRMPTLNPNLANSGSGRVPTPTSNMASPGRTPNLPAPMFSRRNAFAAHAAAVVTQHLGSPGTRNQAQARQNSTPSPTTLVQNGLPPNPNLVAGSQVQKAVIRTASAISNGSESTPSPALRQIRPQPTFVPTPDGFVHPMKAGYVKTHAAALKERTKTNVLFEATITIVNDSMPASFFVKLKDVGGEVHRIENMMKIFYSYGSAKAKVEGKVLTKEEILLNGFYAAYDEDKKSWARVQIVDVDNEQDTPVKVFLTDYGVFKTFNLENLRYMKDYHCNGALRHAYRASCSYIPHEPRFNGPASNFFLRVNAGHQFLCYLRDIEFQNDEAVLYLRFADNLDKVKSEQRRVHSLVDLAI